MRSISIRWMISGVILVTALVVLGIGFWVTARQAIDGFRRDLTESLVQIASAVGDYSVGDLAFGTAEESGKNLAKLRDSTYVEAVAVYDANGSLFSSYVRPGSPRPGLPERMVGDVHAAVNAEAGFVEVYRPLVQQGERFGTIYLRASTARLDDRIRDYVAWLAIVGAGLALLSIAFAFVFQRVVSRPILHLASAAQAVSSTEDWTTRLAERGAREVVHLTRSFNDVLRVVEQRQAQRDEAEATLESRVRDRTARLEASNRELEAFAYSVAHDLRAPLRSVHTFAAALNEDYQASLDDEGKDLLRRIVAASHRMDALIRDLLEYSRVSVKEVELAPVDLDRVVDEALVQLAATIEEKRAEVAVERPLGRATGHHATLLQVVANLLSNAVKFVAAGTTPRVAVRAEGRDGRVRLWIEDNGIGIAPHFHERIFRLFERLHGADAYPGTGVGLAIVKRGMEHMVGGVGLESEPGSGTRFWIELPRAG
jgi:signal transduction histidine kinase